MQENLSLLQGQKAVPPGGSLAVSEQFVVAPVVPIENIGVVSFVGNSENIVSDIGNTEHLPAALATQDPILFTGLVNTIRGLTSAVIGSVMTGPEMAKQYQMMSALRKHSSDVTHGILDNSPAKPTDTIQ